jgi:hypothetical protein
MQIRWNRSSLKRQRLAKDEAPSERRAPATTLSRPLKQFPTVAAEIADRPAAAYYADDNRTNLSNAAVDFIHAGKVDEAEQPARDLLVRSPRAR